MLCSWLRNTWSFLSRKRRQEGAHAPSPRRACFRPTLLLLEDRVVPSTFYVDSNALSDFTLDHVGPGTGTLALPGSQFTPGTLASANGGFGNVYADLFDAVNAANNSPGADTIKVLPGTNPIDSPIEIRDNVTILGYGQGQTTITPGPSLNITTGSGDSRAMILVDRGISANFEALTIDGLASFASTNPTNSIPDAIRYSDMAVPLGTPSANPVSLISHVTFQNLAVNFSALGTDGIAVNVNSGTVNIVGCNFSNIGNIGASYFGPLDPATEPATFGSFLGNTYVGKGTGLDYAAYIADGAGTAPVGSKVATSILVQGNFITNCSGQVFDTNAGAFDNSAAVFVFESSSSPRTLAPTVTVTQNTFQGNQYGLIIGNGSGTNTDTGDTSIVKVTKNNFAGNTLAGEFVTRNKNGPPLKPLSLAGNYFSFNTPLIAPNLSPSTITAIVGKSSGSPFALTFKSPAGDIASISGTISGTVTNSVTKAGINGVTVFLDTNNNGIQDPGEVSTITTTINNVSGSYSFTNLTVLKTGTSYTVRQLLPATAVPTTANPNQFPTSPATAVKVIKLTGTASNVSKVNFTDKSIINVATTTATNLSSSSNSIAVNNPLIVSALISGGTAAATFTGKVFFTAYTTDQWGNHTVISAKTLFARTTANPYTFTKLDAGSHPFTFIAPVPAGFSSYTVVAYAFGLVPVTFTIT